MALFIESLNAWDWSPIYETADPNTAYNIFFDNFNGLYDQHFPVKKVKI